MDAGAGGPDAAQDGGGADADAGQFPELVGGGEGYARDSERAAEVAGHERLVVRGDVEVEFGLLAVAEEDGFDNVHPDPRADVGAIFHGDAGVGVYARERDSCRGKLLIDKLLQWRLEGGWRRGEGLADVECVHGLQEEKECDAGHGDGHAEDFAEFDALFVDEGVGEEDENRGEGHQGGSDAGVGVLHRH